MAMKIQRRFAQTNNIWLILRFQKGKKHFKWALWSLCKTFYAWNDFIKNHHLSCHMKMVKIGATVAVAHQWKADAENHLIFWFQTFAALFDRKFLNIFLPSFHPVSYVLYVSVWEVIFFLFTSRFEFFSKKHFHFI